jgi:hypothetical protein
MAVTMPSSKTGWTAGWLLSGSREQVNNGLGTILARFATNGVLGSVTRQFLGRVSREISDATYGFLNLDLGDLLQEGWEAHQTLVAAARATEHDPAKFELVELAAHTFTATQNADVEIRVDGTAWGTLQFEVTASVRVDALMGKVQLGRLVELQVGACTGTALLACNTVDIAQMRAPLDPPVVVRLGKGLDLLRRSRTPVTPAGPQ